MSANTRANALDCRLTAALDFADPGALLGGLVSQAFDAAAGAFALGSGVVAKDTDKYGQSRWLPWVIGAGLVFMVWNLFYGKPSETPVPEPAIPDASTLEPDTAVYSTALPARIYFEVGAATLSADGYDTIAAVASMINREGLSVAVTGYTDQSGDLALNEELAKDRVLAVVDALRAEGVADSSIRMQPPLIVDAGSSEGTDAEARRVDIDLQ